MLLSMQNYHQPNLLLKFNHKIPAGVTLFSESTLREQNMLIIAEIKQCLLEDDAFFSNHVMCSVSTPCIVSKIAAAFTHKRDSIRWFDINSSNEMFHPPFRLCR